MTRRKTKKSTANRQKSKKRQVKKKKIDKAWGLEFNVFNRGIRQYLDIDYVSKLTPDAKQFLDKFIQTYYNNVFPGKSKPGPKTNMFDKAGIARKELFDQTNARNRDIYTTQYITYDYASDNTYEEHQSIFDINRKQNTNLLEETSIDYLDFKRLVEQYAEEGMTEEQAREKALKQLGINEDDL